MLSSTNSELLNSCNTYRVPNPPLYFHLPAISGPVDPSRLDPSFAVQIGAKSDDIKDRDESRVAAPQACTNTQGSTLLPAVLWLPACTERGWRKREGRPTSWTRSRRR